jgi:hypothetical protein
MVGKKFDGLCDGFCARSGHVDLMKAVVFGSGPNVPPLDAMWCPGLLVFRLL